MFHSQNGEDAWIVKHLELPNKGIFVDIGAASARFRNNTYHFEMNGWKGICIDADPHWFSECSGSCSESGETKCESLPKYRKKYLHAFISNGKDEITFSSRERHVLSRVVDFEERELANQRYSIICKMKPKTLESVLKLHRYKHIDLIYLNYPNL